MARAIQIKPIALEILAERLPSFQHYEKKGGGYWFRRRDNEVYSIVVCSASFKYAHIEFDLYCGLFDDWLGAYGTHLSWAGLRLDNLRFRSHSINVDDIGYRHDQTRDGIVDALNRGIDDLEKFAIPYFAELVERIRTHPLVAASFAYIRSHGAEIPVTVDEDIQRDLETHGFFDMVHPHFIGLRDHLREVAKAKNVSREEKKEISKLVFDMYHLYALRNGQI